MNDRTAIHPSFAISGYYRRPSSASDDHKRRDPHSRHCRGPERGIRCKIGLLSAALSIATGCGVRQAAPDPEIPPAAVSVPFVSLARLEHSALDNEARMVVRTRAEWVDLWASATEGSGPADNPPEVDFGRRMVLVAALGRRATGGFAIRVGAVYEDRERLYAIVTETAPGSGCLATQALTSPMSAVSIPLSGKPVNFVTRSETLPCY